MKSTCSLLLALLLFSGGAEAPAQEKDDAKVKALLKERLATLRTLVEQTTKEYTEGRASFDRVHQATTALLHAELELGDSDKARIAVLEKLVAQAKKNEEVAATRYKSGVAPASDALLAAAGRLEAEIALERARAKVAQTCCCSCCCDR
jgi:outer membrane protein TolC